jgi:N-acyl-D-aspartate/D-glutamate deacylase
MGDRAVRLEAATDDDLAEMAALAREGLDAGAMGIATSRTLFHRSSDGNPIPTLRASEEELVMLAGAMRETGKGIFQLTGDLFGTADGVDLLRQLNAESGRPVTFTTGTGNSAPYYWQALLDRVRDANQDGASLHPQILPRAVGVLLGFELTLNPFSATPTYRTLADLPLQEKLTALRRPEIRERILSEGAAIEPGLSIGSHIRQFQSMFQLGDPPRYEQPPEASVAGRAERLGAMPDALAYDLLLEKDGRAQLYLAIANYPDGNLDAVSAMMRHPDTLPGLGDGGAHCATICDGSYSTFLLTYHARDREGLRLSVSAAVRKLTAAPAEVIGLHDRGRIAPGYKADINIIDFDRLAIRAPTVTHDLPGGGRRVVQRADGYRATIVNGVPVYRDGEPTGALPGRLVRGGQPTPLR